MFLGRNFEYGGTIANLEQNKGNYKGVYIIVYPDDFQNVNLKNASNAGRYKGKNPSVSVENLKQKWVDGANILYIGKSETSVKKRMQQHIDFWNGKAVAAYGGRVIAQIQNFEDLEVWYLACDNPKETESNLLLKFKKLHEKLPFANWRL